MYSLFQWYSSRSKVNKLGLYIAWDFEPQKASFAQSPLQIEKVTSAVSTEGEYLGRSLCDPSLWMSKWVYHISENILLNNEVDLIKFSLLDILVCTKWIKSHYLYQKYQKFKFIFVEVCCMLIISYLRKWVHCSL